jgi:hypothetical protein
MSMPSPTPREAARYIVKLMVEKYSCRAGHTIRLSSLIGPFTLHPWRPEDINLGLPFAAEIGWISNDAPHGMIKLTEKGVAMLEDDDMNLKGQCNEDVTLEKVSGERHENVRALVTNEIILIPDASLPIESDDAILRKLPSGIVQRLVVTDPVFFQKIHGTPAHYQLNYRKEGQKPAGTPGYNFNFMGDNARLNVNSTDNSINTVSHSTENLAVIGEQLATLRSTLGPKAYDAEHYAALGAVASAEIAAKAGDGSKMKSALSALGSGAKWVLDGAKDIGVSVAAELIKSSMQG